MSFDVVPTLKNYILLYDICPFNLWKNVKFITDIHDIHFVHKKKVYTSIKVEHNEFKIGSSIYDKCYHVDCDYLSCTYFLTVIGSKSDMMKLKLMSPK